MDIKGIAAVVTGAASGLGEATARELAARGAKVAVFDRDLERGEQVAADMQRYRQEAGVDAFQINFNGCHSLDQLMESMDCLMQDVKPLVAS